MTLFLQKSNCTINMVCIAELTTPMVQDPAAMGTVESLLMLMGYLRGLQIATYQSKAIILRSTYTAVPIAKPRNIYTAHPGKEMAFLSERKLTSVEQVEGMEVEV